VSPIKSLYLPGRNAHVSLLRVRRVARTVVQWLSPVWMVAIERFQGRKAHFGVNRAVWLKPHGSHGSRIWLLRLPEELRRADPARRPASEGGRVRALVSHSLMRTAIGTRRRIDWGHAIAQEKRFRKDNILCVVIIPGPKKPRDADSLICPRRHLWEC
jgi:hypothetical protein